jgi:hypothetical protein
MSPLGTLLTCPGRSGSSANDEAWNRPLGVISFAPDVLHDVRSVSKSVVAQLYGIALAAGKVPPPEAKLYEQFLCNGVDSRS